MLSKPEYKEVNNTVYLTLRNKISLHSKTISQNVMEAIENDWENYNEMQIKILQFLFLKNKATLADFIENVAANEKTNRRYLNSFVDLGIIEQLSEKQRNIIALYVLKKE